ncbi:putative Propanoyl-CoA C-acyltransferase [Rhodotorula taiwanensis]|uniref:propanoyl-CoA C-acyltransferase n=1 Tax=Rhodotorula taiwanensis TaxID=741276 RepID=A0A2S5BBG7_9BASI|nr:putative Propanoyl-CoA C-acyltransferase [Rhodotorula taiwanensis]
MTRKAYVAGIGLTAFAKPRNQIDYPELAVEAATKALLDAGINYDEVEQAFAGYVYGDSTCGQRALYALGLTAIPIINVNNNCSTGSSALWLARQAVEYGISDCVMALGFEKMAPGSLTNAFSDRDPPLSKTVGLMSEMGKMSQGPFAAQIFGNGGDEYCQKFGATREHLAKIASKSHRHSVNNPYAQFQHGMSADQILKDQKVTRSLTRSMCCPTSDGAGCAIVCSEDFVKRHGLENQAIEIAAMGMATDSPRLFEDRSSIELAGVDMTRRAAKEAFSKAGITPQDVQLIELHDCFAPNELLTYDALGLTPPGKAHELVDAGDNTYGGRYVVNASGGLLAKGHPLGATGLGMAFYCCTQLRGWAGPMQDPRCVPGELEKHGETAYTLAHNVGLGGSAVVTIFRRPDFYRANGKPDGRDRLGYNHGCECKRVATADVDKVKSKKAFSKWAEAAL